MGWQTARARDTCEDPLIVNPNWRIDGDVEVKALFRFWVALLHFKSTAQTTDENSLGVT